MRLMLHIFWKDARRLWYEITIALALLVMLARWDCYRADSVPSPIEGWLNPLLTVVWGYLVVLLVHGEAPVGDRQFWITRPYRWPALLGAKAFFALTFIHLASLLADCAVVAARGFSPLDSLSALVWKQVLLAAALTLPVAALAAISRNLVQFVPTALLIFGAALLLAGGLELTPMGWILVDPGRLGVAWLALVVASVVIVWLQYARRRTAISRILALGTVLLAGLVVAYLPREYTFRARCALSRVPREDRHLYIEFDPEKAPAYPYGGGLRYPMSTVRLAIPIQALGLDQRAAVYFSQLDLAVLDPHGQRWEPKEERRMGMLLLPGHAGGISARPVARGHVDYTRGWQYLQLDRSSYDRLKGAKVKLVGRAFATFSRQRDAGRIPALGTGVLVSGVGRCSSVQVLQKYEDKLKVVCESPFHLPTYTGVTLLHRSSGKAWKEGLGNMGTEMPYPTVTWLSPLNRSQTFFTVAEEARGPGSQYLVPYDLLPQAEIEFVALERTGWTILRYEMRDIDLQQFEVKRVRR